MENSKCKGLSEEEASKMLDEILEEDEREIVGGDEEEGLDEEISDSCPAACAEEEPPIERTICECMRIAENSSRFSLRVMEAMRRLQDEEDAPLPTCSAEDIVGYIESNYRDDGDLYAQVRTALKQVCSQGFVIELFENEYHLIGPDAVSMNRTSGSNDRGDHLLPKRAKASPKCIRKENELEEDTCDCETSTVSDKPRKSSGSSSRKISRSKASRSARPNRDDCSKKYAGRKTETENTDTVSEEVPEFSSSMTPTDENENDCTCFHETDKDTRNAFTTQEKLQRSVTKNRNGRKGRNRAIEYENARLASSALSQRDETMEDEQGNDDNDSETEKAMLDDIYQELKTENTPRRSPQREKELKRWIKRCKQECENRAKRQRMDN